MDDKMVDLIPDLLPSELEGCAYPRHDTSHSIDAINVSHLLNHRAGFEPTSDPTYWHWNTWDNKDDDCLDIDGLNVDYDQGNLAPIPMERILSEWLRRPLENIPGEDYAYSNIGYQILGQIIEAQSGMGYEAYILENVLTPMGIDSMSIGMTMPDQRAENEVTYYDYEGDSGACHFPSGTDNETGEPIFETAADPDCGDFVVEEKDGGGGWIATAADYARFLAHIDGTLTTTAFNDSFDYFIQNPYDNVGSWYGRGVYIVYGNVDVWDHNGAFSGSSTTFKRDVTDDGEPVIAVLLTNTRPGSSLQINDQTWNNDRSNTLSNEMMAVNYSNLTFSKPLPPDCTPGDTQPAEDGCNNCVCTEDEIWACTMIYCPDEGEDNETEVEEIIPCNPGDTKPADDGCNTCVCTENEEWACTLMYCPDDINRIPRISMWPGKVNQHNDNGKWLTDPDGVSGGHSSDDHPNDYGDRKLEYCQKFWPDTHDVYLLPDKETITFYTQGNQDAYESTKDVYQCVGANG
ncbi:MAG: serine hydrolase, partial [Candidatus Poseidoniales archaeon]|nr:serine hydrolase [Candidatus Poseidoniales archaeon]